MTQPTSIQFKTDKISDAELIMEAVLFYASKNALDIKSLQLSENYTDSREIIVNFDLYGKDYK